MGPNGTDGKHSLEEHFWHVGSTTSTVAPWRVARLGWLPRRAKLHDGWRRNRKICRCLSNVQPTISSSQIFPNRNLHRLGKTGHYLQLRSFTFLHCMISTRDHFSPCWLSQSCYSCAAAPAVDVGPNGTGWQYNFNSGTLARARLGWLPSQANLPLHDGWRRT